MNAVCPAVATVLDELIDVAAPVAPPPPERVLKDSDPAPSVTRAWSSTPSVDGNWNPEIVDIPVEYMLECIPCLKVDRPVTCTSSE